MKTITTDTPEIKSLAAVGANLHAVAAKLPTSDPLHGYLNALAERLAQSLRGLLELPPLQTQHDIKPR